MTRVLRSATKKIQNSADLSSKLNINKKSKSIKRRDKKDKEIKNEDKKQTDIWSINSVLSNIFIYVDYKDLVQLNTVCKKWNHLTNSIIHRTIKLNRSWNIIKQAHDKRFSKNAKIDLEVKECICNNAKHAPLVKELYYDYKLYPQRAIKVFETFRFICILTIERCNMSQDQFLGMIGPLTQLQELTLIYFRIKRIIYKRLYKEAFQLPPTLKKLRLDSIELINNPELFIQTINSHNNLIEFSSESCSSIDFLKPFYKTYSSLIKFQYAYRDIEIHQFLIKIFENNPQLVSLILNLNYWNSELISYINGYLSKLEELFLLDSIGYHQDYTDLKFSQPTNIRKLRLFFYRLGNCSLDSILLNCPHLEELKLNQFIIYMQPSTDKFVKISVSFSYRILDISYDEMSERFFESILLNFPNMKDSG